MLRSSYRTPPQLWPAPCAHGGSSTALHAWLAGEVTVSFISDKNAKSPGLSQAAAVGSGGEGGEPRCPTSATHGLPGIKPSAPEAVRLGHAATPGHLTGTAVPSMAAMATPTPPSIRAVASPRVARRLIRTCAVTCRGPGSGNESTADRPPPPVRHLCRALRPLPSHLLYLILSLYCKEAGCKIDPLLNCAVI